LPEPCIPPERAGDLIYLHPNRRVVGLNPLDCALDDAELVADQLLDLIHQLADNWGPVIEETLKATLVLLAATPSMTLVEMPAVLLDAGFRRRVLASLDPAFAPTVGEFFARYEAWNPGQQAMAASAALNKVTPFLDRRPIRAMLGQDRPAWSMRQVIDEGKILVVALPSGVIGPVAADLVGGIIATMAWNAALGRQTVSREHRRPVSVVIDELPRFVRGGGTSLADMLARARGHGMGLVGAVQHIGQVRPDLRAALMSEARSKVILQPAADDAALLARHLPGVEAQDLMTLEAHHAVASLIAGGRVAAPVTIQTLPPPPPTGHGNEARAASHATYGRDMADVERAITRRRQGPGPGPRRTRRIEP
jgi:type IV secretion system coupling TraD/TrwB family protein